MTALDVRPPWHAPSRRQPPAQPGDVLTLWDRFEHREVTVTVEIVRWDSWLYGGEWRIFAVAGGTYYTSADVRSGDLLSLLLEPDDEPVGNGSVSAFQTCIRMNED